MRRPGRAVCLLLFLAAMPAPAGVPVARVAELAFGSNGLVPVISRDVCEAPYSADPTGRKDSTAAFAQALADADESGGTVFVPAGTYRIGGRLTIPPGVTLRGDFRRPTEDQPEVVGSVLMAFADRGKRDGKPFVEIDEGGLRDLSIFYPEQDAREVVPYPVCLNLKGNSAVENINLVNPFTAMVTGPFSTVSNVYGSPLDTGIIMLSAAAVPRCNGVSFSPLYWSGSGLSGAPSFAEVRDALKARNAHAIQLNRQDAGIFIDIDIDHYPTAVKVMPPHGWTYWHNLRVRNAEVGMHFVGGSDQRVSMTGSSISARRHGILMQMDRSGWDPGWTELSKSGKAYGTKQDSASLRLFGCRFAGVGGAISLDGSFRQSVDVQECVFESWGTNRHAVSATGGTLKIFDSVFESERRHVRFRGDPKLLQLVGNRFGKEADLDLPMGAESNQFPTGKAELGGSVARLEPVPDTLPARTGPDSLHVVNHRPFSAPSDGEGDATEAIQAALDRAGREGGGTVYLLQGRYRVTASLVVPAGVELRGVNDCMPRGDQVRSMIIADLPAHRGEPDNLPLIQLRADSQRGGSGVSGLGIWYLHQNYREIQAFPWTIRSYGPGCWVRRVFLGNSYNAVDFATHDSDRHVLSRVNGSALNIAFKVGKSKTIGWIDNCHIRPQDWAAARGRDLQVEFPGNLSNKPTKRDVFRGTEHSLIPNLRGGGVITIDSGANEQITGFFTNGATRAFDFVDGDGTGGGNATIMIGGSEAGWGAWVKALGPKGVTFVNFSINPMTRLPYVEPAHVTGENLPKGMVMRVDRTVPTTAPVHFIISKFYAREEVARGFDLRGGEIIFKQVEQEHDYGGPAVDVEGASFETRNVEIGEVRREP